MTYLHDIAMRWTAPRKHARRNPIRCVVDMARFDQAYQRHRLYLPKDRDPTAWKCDQFRQFAATVEPEEIRAPTVLFRSAPGGVQVRFIQGRHRYRVMHDAGLSRLVVVTWGRKSLWFGMVNNIIIECLDRVGHIKPVKSRRTAA